jgi:hypothetical protein
VAVWNFTRDLILLSNPSAERSRVVCRSSIRPGEPEASRVEQKRLYFTTNLIVCSIRLTFNFGEANSLPNPDDFFLNIWSPIRTEENDFASYNHPGLSIVTMETGGMRAPRQHCTASRCICYSCPRFSRRLRSEQVDNFLCV